MLDKALEIAKAAHEGQVDVGGAEYINHPIEVAEHCEDEDAKIVDLLHDVIEDSKVTLDDLRSQGFKDEIIEAIDIISGRSGIGYDEYLQSIKDNDLARVVKIQDLIHNSDLSRLRVVRDKDRNRVKRYEEALEFLRS